MTKEEIIELALTVFDEHPYDKGHVVSPTGYTWIDDSLVEFANRVAVKERERCANVCDKIYKSNYPDCDDWERSEEGDAIRSLK